METATLGKRMAKRRDQLGISQASAARIAGVSRTSWIAWENDRAVPESYNHVKIELVLRWAPGSVQELRDGGEPTPIVEARPDPDVDRLRGLYRSLRDKGMSHADALAIIDDERDRITEDRGSTFGDGERLG